MQSFERSLETRNIYFVSLSELEMSKNISEKCDFVFLCHAFLFEILKMLNIRDTMTDARKERKCFVT